MAWLRYSYTIQSDFTPAVGYHAFKARVVPMETPFQHVVEQAVRVNPTCPLLYAEDGFGNTLVYGSLQEQHRHFLLESTGLVETREYRTPCGAPPDYYLFPSPQTAWNAEIRALASGKNALDIMHAVHRHLSYERFRTDNSTTAAQVFRLGRGVCQDYAHLLIAACRSQGLHARYVNGLAPGEGETHAWVEVYQDGAWLGLDPTRDCPIAQGYLKLAHGRDVGDCPSNRGRLYQWTTETLSVNCKLKTL